MTDDRRILRCDQLKENIDDFRIIWLDANIDHSDDSTKIKTMLSKLNPAAQCYTDSSQCITVIKSNPDEQIVLIMSGSFAQSVLPEIHHIQSINAIFIFCKNRELYKSLKDKYDKIIEIVVDHEDLLQSLVQTLNHLEKRALSFSLFDRKQQSSRDLSKESAAFLWHQLLLHVLTQMPQNEQSKEELLLKCKEYYQFDNKQMNKIEIFRKTFSHEKAIECYTEECFLYKLLNKALRSENIELIYSFRFFIIHLSSQIKQEHAKLKKNEVFSVYRGQIVSTEELERWKNNHGTIISINGFFSTSRDMNVSLKFARDDYTSGDFRRVLFEIEVDPSIKTLVYADTSHIGYHPDEQEILFNLNSLFEIITVEPDSTSDIWKIKLKTTHEGTRDIEEYLKYIQQEIDDCSSIICFGWLLLNGLGQVDQAEKYFNMLLETLPNDHEDIAAVYNGIGCVHSKRNELIPALEKYEKALKLRQERLPSNHIRIAASLHNVANILRAKGNFNQALDYYQQALDIEQSHHDSNRLLKAVITQNIGNTYTAKHEFETALKHLFCAYEMYQNILPGKHSIISTCLSDIGFVYENKDDFQRALNCYQEALKIDEDCLPSDHPHIFKDLQNIIFAYKKSGQIEEALTFCSKKLAELENTPGDNYNRIAQISMLRANVIQEKHFEEALRFYEDALTNFKKSRPIDKRAIAKCLHNTGYLYEKHCKFDDAIPKLLKALIFYRDSLSDVHINIAEVCQLIGLCYKKTNKPLEALNYFNESLTIYRAIYGLDHKIVQTIEKDIAKLNSEQQTIAATNDTKAAETAVVPIIEEVNSEQIIPVIIDSVTPAVIVEPLPLPAIDSASTSQSARSEIKNEPKAPVKKRKYCQNCQIL